MREKQVAAERKDLVEIAARASLLQELLHEGSISREVYEKKSDELAQQREVAEKEQDELDVAGEGAKTVVVSVDDEEGEGSAKDGKRKRKNFEVVAKYETKEEAQRYLTGPDRCFKRINSSKSYKGGPLGAIYRDILYEDSDLIVRLWFEKTTSKWVVSKCGHEGTKYSIVKKKISPYLKQKLIPLLQKDDGRPVKVLDELKKEAEEKGDEVLKQMCEEISYKQVASLRRGLMKPKRELKGEAEDLVSPTPDAIHPVAVQAQAPQDPRVPQELRDPQVPTEQEVHDVAQAMDYVKQQVS